MDKKQTTIQLLQLEPDEFRAAIVADLRAEFAQLLAAHAPPQPDDYLTRQQTAEMLKINLSTLWAWTKRGKLTAYGLGNRVYYRRSQVEAALTQIN